MSKRISVLINNIRPSLGILFREYLHRKSLEKKSVKYDEDYYDEVAEYWDKVFPGWDDEPSSCDGELVYPLLGSKRGKKGKHKRGNKRKHSKVIDLDVPYSGYEGSPTEVDDEYDDNDYQSKVIWFYPDYHYKDDRLEFNSLKSFDKYCSENGYHVPKYVEYDIVYRSESHCCLSPSAEKEGLLEIMSEDSYGDMFYEACDASELSGDFEWA